MNLKDFTSTLKDIFYKFSVFKNFFASSVQKIFFCSSKLRSYSSQAWIIEFKGETLWQLRRKSIIGKLKYFFRRNTDVTWSISADVNEGHTCHLTLQKLFWPTRNLICYQGHDFGGFCSSILIAQHFQQAMKWHPQMLSIIYESTIFIREEKGGMGHDTKNM